MEKIKVPKNKTSDLKILKEKMTTYINNINIPNETDKNMKICRKMLYKLYFSVFLYCIFLFSG